MSTRRQRQILRNKRIAFERTMDENIKKSKEKPEPQAEPEKKEETKIVKKKKTTKKEDK